MDFELETYGCAMNQADSEIICGLLERHGHRRVKEKGEIVVINTCTVKTPTENKIRKKLRELAAKKRRVVVAGCLPAAQKKIADEFPRFCFIGVNPTDVVEAAAAAAGGRRYVAINAPEEKVCMPKNRLNRFVEITPIAEGCLGECSYCITRAARGKLKSFQEKRVVEHVKHALADGVREVWITAQDTGAYGLDRGTSLPKLLNAITQLPGDFKVRVGMMNPNHVIPLLDELVDAYANEKIYRFAHLPVQSGSDMTLKEMGRRYTVEDFRRIVNALRKKLNTTISTDVIVGYPTEGEEEFKETLKLINEVKPDVLNISRFWPRPGTKAAEMKQHPGRVTKERSRETNEVFKEVGLTQNRKWLDWQGTALVSEKNDDGTYTARNQWYRPIIIKCEDDIMGEKVEVKVSKATYYDLRGRLL